MHKGNKVWVLSGSKIFHYTDDDCPVTSSMLQGKKKYREITEEEAVHQGFKLCKNCRKEYMEDTLDTPFRMVTGIIKLIKKAF